VLWADLDGADAVRALERFEPALSIVIASGTGENCHAYWPLTVPLPRDEVERANRRLAYALGADPASADSARILRIPGTWSHKHRPPAPVRALRLDVERRLDAADVVGGLTDPPKPAPAAAAPRVHHGNDPLLGIAPEDYVRRLLGVEVPRHRKVPCPFHPDRRASLHVYESAERGWYCFGRCRRGGTIHDLAALLYGLQPRGEDFLRLRAELRRTFGLGARSGDGNDGRRRTWARQRPVATQADDGGRFRRSTSSLPARSALSLGPAPSASPSRRAVTAALQLCPLGPPDHEPESGGPAAQATVKGDELTPKQQRERDVVGVVGLRPAELVCHRPGVARQRSRLRASDGRGEQSPERRLGLLAAPHRRVQRRYGLDP
jgi:RepB DNA-primase from phage plasmid